MAQLKTQRNSGSVQEFLKSVPDAARRKECQTVLSIMRMATGMAPAMWGGTIVGFGTRHYRYASGREGDWFLTGFSPRKQNLTLYIIPGFAGFQELLARLGPHKTGKSCLYIRRLDDVNLSVLEELIRRSVANHTGTSSS